jgi:fibro-slime domain-containing protein
MRINNLLLVLAMTTAGCSNASDDVLGGAGNSGGGNNVIRLDGGLGGAGGGANPGTTTGSTGELTIVIRDFKFYDSADSSTNLDFENVPKTDQYGNPDPNYYGNWDDKDIVTDTLGDDFKPIYKNVSTPLTTHGQAAFDQWFRTVDGTNIVKEIPLTLSLNAAGSYEYDSQNGGALSPGGMFFPIDDGTTYATSFGNQGKSHNYSFTGEIHTVFTYKGGETFNFRGDDDVFVYIDNKLVINLGGIHGKEDGSVSIDSLGLTKGQSYPLDFFYAERHVVESNMRITTSLELVTNPNIPIF